MKALLALTLLLASPGTAVARPLPDKFDCNHAADYFIFKKRGSWFFKRVFYPEAIAGNVKVSRPFLRRSQAEAGAEESCQRLMRRPLW